jgi:hypothetical protein
MHQEDNCKMVNDIENDDDSDDNSDDDSDDNSNSDKGNGDITCWNFAQNPEGEMLSSMRIYSI